jgi:hypothetical protein
LDELTVAGAEPCLKLHHDHYFQSTKERNLKIKQLLLDAIGLAAAASSATLTLSRVENPALWF